MNIDVYYTPPTVVNVIMRPSQQSIRDGTSPRSISLWANAPCGGYWPGLAWPVLSTAAKVPLSSFSTLQAKQVILQVTTVIDRPCAYSHRTRPLYVFLASTEQLGRSGDAGAAKTVLLVSGVGRPRNQKHRLEDNSTEVTAELMEVYLNRHYPEVKVERVHSDTNIFRCVSLIGWQVVAHVTVHFGTFHCFPGLSKRNLCS